MSEVPLSAAPPTRRAGDTINTNPLFPGIDFDVAPAQRGSLSLALSLSSSLSPLSLSLYLPRSFFLSLYMYISLFLSLSLSLYIYIYIYISHTHRQTDKQRERARERELTRDAFTAGDNTQAVFILIQNQVPCQTPLRSFLSALGQDRHVTRKTAMVPLFSSHEPTERGS